MRERLGFWAGLAGFCLLLLLPAPDGMGAAAWRVTALAFLMACWWMTEALPIPAPALLPFHLLPLLGVSTPSAVAASDRQSVVSGKSVSVRLDLGGSRIIKNTKNNNRS